ncbi:MAG: Fe-S cluster assembly protein SufD [Pyrinomonadaceae bacterium]|nr:Fe-S cluster assembly protein SufD [Blastocatellia bacterium]MCW5957252.1 Fe-S cluster assembly protein SufD [Pyrinomonadaceae bacterium]
MAKENSFGTAFYALINSEQDTALHSIREKAFRVFQEKGLPTVGNEDWKYTNVAPIAAIDWTVDDSAMAVGQIVPTELLNAFRFERNGFTALNLAFANVAILRISKETIIDEPIEFDFAGEAGKAIFPHIIVIAESGSKATVVEKYASQTKSLTNTAIQIFVEDNANLTHYRVQKESAEAFHYGVTEVTVNRGGSYNATSINLGGALSRHDIEVKFTAEGGEAWVDGLYMLNGTQHHDTHSVIDHTVPNCTSHQNYRGVLNDKSRAVFNGKVFVRENAHGTDAEQSNKNLLLSNDARVDTKPQLEIFNDDVKCSHGATVGQLEDEELFYLLARGIPEGLARNLLTYGFAEEVINKIGVESIKRELDGMVLNRLNAKI